MSLEVKEVSSDHSFKSGILRSISCSGEMNDIQTNEKNQTSPSCFQKSDIIMEQKMSEFHKAVCNNDIDKVRQMLECGIDPNTEETYSQKLPLIEATKRGHVEIVKILLNSRADINKCNIQGTSALHTCMNPTNINTEIIRLFIENCKTNFNIQDKISDSTPLHVLARVFCSNKNVHPKIKNILREVVPRCNLHLKDTWGNTPLHIVAKSKKEDLEIVEIILSEKPDVNARNYLGETPVAIAINHGNFQTALAILNHDVDTDVRDRVESPLIHYAAKKNAFEVLQKLLEKGSNVNAQDPFGDTALHISAGRGFENVISILLKHPQIEINKQNNGGYTPLMCAVDSCFIKAVKLLLDAKCDTNVRSYRTNKTAMDIAKELVHKRNKRDIYEILSQNNKF